MTPQAAPEPAAARAPRSGPLAARRRVLRRSRSLYAWQASRRVVADDLHGRDRDHADLPRDRRDGHAVAARRADGFGRSYTYLVAPAWWIDDVDDRLRAVKLIGVLVDDARRSSPPTGWRASSSRARWAVARRDRRGRRAGARLRADPGRGAARLSGRRRSRSGRSPPRSCGRRAAGSALAGALCLVAPFVARLAPRCCSPSSAPGSFCRCSGGRERFTRWRATWTQRRLGRRGDARRSALALVVSAARRPSLDRVVRRDAASRSTACSTTALWAAGALTIGLGVLRSIATALAFALRPRARARPRVARSSSSTLAAFVAFGLYTAVKAAYLSTMFATLIVERNLIYLVPLLFAATAAVLAAPSRPPWALAAACVVALLPRPRRPSSGSTSTRTSRPRAWRSSRSRTATSSGTGPTSSARSWSWH